MRALARAPSTGTDRESLPRSSGVSAILAALKGSFPAIKAFVPSRRLAARCPRRSAPATKLSKQKTVREQFFPLIGGCYDELLARRPGARGLWICPSWPAARNRWGRGGSGARAARLDTHGRTVHDLHVRVEDGSAVRRTTGRLRWSGSRLPISAGSRRAGRRRAALTVTAS